MHSPTTETAAAGIRFGAFPRGIVDAGLVARMTGRAVKVFVILARYADYPRFHAWPSIETISGLAGIGRRAVQTALRQLADLHVIAIIAGGGRHRSNDYQLIGPPENSAPQSAPTSQNIPENKRIRRRLSPAGAGRRSGQSRQPAPPRNPTIPPSKES